MEKLCLAAALAALVLCAALALRTARRDRALRALAAQLEHFLIYPDSPLPASLAEGELTNLQNLISRLEELLIYCRRSAENREREMARFTENMAHQMKNTLTAMQIQLDLLEAGMTEELMDTMGKCQDSMSRLTGEIDRILRSEELAEGKIAMSFEPVELRRELETVVRRLEPAARAKGVAVELRGPALTLPADPFWLPQALENVVKNAVEHTGPGTRVAVELSDEGRNARVLVADEGPGIPPSELPKLFERFHRGVTSKAGYGIGLSMARDVLEAHHGSISARNREGGGAVFEIAVPILSHTRPYAS